MSRDLILLGCALSAWGLGEGMFFYFQPLYLQELGADPFLIGTILGTVGVAMTVVHLPAGYLADRIGRRPLMIAAWVMGLIAAWIMALAPTLSIFAFGAVMYGSTSFVAGPMSSYVTAARGKLPVGRALTLVQAGYSAGGILGPPLGGWIGAHFGLHRIFMISATVFILSTSLVFFLRPQPREDASPTDQSAGLRKLLSPTYLRLLIIVALAMFVMYLPQPLSQNFLQNVRGISLDEIGLLASFVGIGTVLFNLALGQLNSRRGLLLAMGFMCLFTILIWQGNSLLWYLAAYLCMGSFRVVRSLASALARSLVDATNMGLAYGTIETVSSLSVILAPPVAGWLYAHNPHLIYSASLPAIAVVLILAWLGLPDSGLLTNEIKK